MRPDDEAIADGPYEGRGKRPLPLEGGLCQRSVEEPMACFAITSYVVGVLAVDFWNVKFELLYMPLRF